MFVGNRGKEEVVERGAGVALHGENLAGDRSGFQTCNGAARVDGLSECQQIHQLHFDLHIDGRVERWKVELKTLVDGLSAWIADLNEEKRTKQLDNENVMLTLKSEFGVQSTKEMNEQREKNNDTSIDRSRVTRQKSFGLWSKRVWIRTEFDLSAIRLRSWVPFRR